METNILKMITIADCMSIANALCGFLAMFFILKGENILSAQLLLLAVVFDCLDGTVARMLNTRSGMFGENIDSLADIVSFGVAPAIIMYMISPSQWIIIPAALVVICGLLRLTRYNTLVVYQEGPTKTFLGLPIPVTSTILAALILSSFTDMYLISVLMIIISILMVSEVKYPKIKNNKILIPFTIVVILCMIPGVNTLLYSIPSYVLLIAVAVYIFGVFIKNLNLQNSKLSNQINRSYKNTKHEVQSLHKKQ